MFPGYYFCTFYWPGSYWERPVSLGPGGGYFTGRAFCERYFAHRYFPKPAAVPGVGGGYFPGSAFAERYFPHRYWAKVPPVIPPVTESAGGDSGRLDYSYAAFLARLRKRRRDEMLYEELLVLNDFDFVQTEIDFSDMVLVN